MSEQREYRYSPPGPCPTHSCCVITRCVRFLCPATFHLPLDRRGQPRRYCSPACRAAEHRRLHM